LAISSDESEVITGGSDSLINMWKDYTSEDEQNLLQANETRILQFVICDFCILRNFREQELSNSLAHKNYKRALEIAFALEQPRRIFLIFEELFSTGPREFLKAIM
jgi:U3 small nucleolar RNA-associated protein 13